MTIPKQIDALDLAVTAFTAGGEELTTIGKAVDNLTKQEMAKSVRSRKAVHAREANRLLRAWRTQEDRNVATLRKRRRITSLLKAEITRRNVAEIEAETATILRKVESANLVKAESEQALATAQAEQIRLTAEMDQLGARVNTVVSRFNAAQEQVQKSQEDAAARIAARQERDQSEWTFKASTVTDPTLRAAYLARADGRRDIDDDD